MTWLMEGANAGYFSADGTRFWQADRRPGQDTFTAHWHQDDPGVLPAGDNTGAGAPAGVVRYESDAAGQPVSRAAVERRCRPQRRVRLSPEAARGAGFALERFDFLSSLPAPNANYIWNQVDQDRRKWFRPSDVAVGPDGAIYVADWFDPIVGGHQMHDRRGYGRIYRITPKGRRLTTPAIDLTTTAGTDPGAAQPGGQRARRRVRAVEGQRRGGAAGGAEDPRGRQPVPSRARDLAARGARPGGRSRSRAAARRSRSADPASPRSARCARSKPSVLAEARRLVGRSIDRRPP